MYTDPYKECPILKSNNFLLRLVEENDAKDLLECYSDIKALPLFNSDNCPMDFYFDCEDKLLELIQFWLYEYSYGGYVRFSILDRKNSKAIGTIEIFAKKEVYDFYNKVGVLRLDLKSTYENEDVVSELFTLIQKEFRNYFKIDYIVTKVKEPAVIRKNVLTSLNFEEVKDMQIVSYPYYFIGKV